MHRKVGWLIAAAAAVGIWVPEAGAAVPRPPAIEVSASFPCTPGACRPELSYRPERDLAEGAVLAIDWDHAGAAATGFTEDATLPCAAGRRCRLAGPVYARKGRRSVVARLTVPGYAPVYASRTVVVKPQTQSFGEECAPAQTNVNCGPGNGRRTPGGAAVEKVSHVGWPAVTGILWQVLSSRATHRKTGGVFNDELLGHHGNDVLDGGPGDDILWGDWDPVGNGTRQVDVLRGGAGDDFIYGSHGRNTISGGPGDDFVYAYFGKGTIDCGPGLHDVARIRTTGAFTTRGCETIRNFCGFGQKPGGGCYKPGENPNRRTRRLTAAG